MPTHPTAGLPVGPAPGPGSRPALLGNPMAGVGPQASTNVQRFGSLFGTSTPRQMIATNQAPGAPAPSPVNDQGTATPQIGAIPGLPPEQAGVVQSAAPGAQNGNTAGGFVNPAQPPAQPAPPPGAPPVGAPQPIQPQPVAAPPGPGAPGPPGGPGGVIQPSFPGLPPEFQVPGMQGILGGPAPVDPIQELAKMATEGAVQDGGVAGLGGGGQFVVPPPLELDPVQSDPVDPLVDPITGLPTDPIGATVDPVTGEPIGTGVGGDDVVGPELVDGPPPEGAGNFNDQGINGPDGFKSWADAGWNAISNNVGRDERTDARVSYIENSDGAFTENFWGNAFGPDGVTGATHPMPNPADTQYNINLTSGDIPDSFWDDVTEPGLQDLARKWAGWITRLEAEEQKSGEEKRLGLIQDLNKKLRVAEAALGQYGINTSEAGGEFPDTDGTDDIFGDARSRQEQDPFQRATTDVMNEPKLITQLFGPPAGRSKEERVAAAELAAQMNAQRAGEFNAQLGTNELRGALEGFQGSDFFGAIQDQANVVAGQENLDFQPIRNQAIEDSARGFESLTSSLGGLAGQSGRTASSLAGLQTEAALGQSANVARLLGDLSVQEQLTGRQFAQENLQALIQGFGATESPVAQLRQQIASALGADVGQTFNPLSGALSAQGAIKGLDLSEQQIDATKDAQRMSQILAAIQGGGSILAAL